MIQLEIGKKLLRLVSFSGTIPLDDRYDLDAPFMPSR